MSEGNALSSRHVQNRRRGQAAILMVLFLLVVLAGILALTLDFGLVLQARRQMQTGVNSAALEGARNVDVDQDGAGDGRQNVVALVENIYDDDLDPSANATTVGAGVDGSLVQGNGYRANWLGDPTTARDLYLRRSEFVYRPTLQLNEDNEPHGDLVRGTYDLESNEDRSEECDEMYDPDQDRAIVHCETAQYARPTDFEADQNGDAFLVRLRRTHDPAGLDNEPGVSSAGSGMPLMMGRLGWMSATANDASYSIRRDGVAVRATAIADQRVAMRVWPDEASVDTFGAIPFWIRRSDFLAAENPAAATRRTPLNALLTIVGEEADFDASSLPTTPVDSPGYVAVVDSSLTPPRVIGFWLAPDSSVSNRLPNASARLQDAWEVLGSLSAAERESVFDSQRAVVTQGATNNDPPNGETLLTAPSLVRTVR